MIDGLKVRVPGAKVHELLLREADRLKDQADRLIAEAQPGLVLVDAKEKVRTRKLRRAAYNVTSAEVCTFIAEHIDFAEVYELTEYDISEHLGIGAYDGPEDDDE